MPAETTPAVAPAATPDSITVPISSTCSGRCTSSSCNLDITVVDQYTNFNVSTDTVDGVRYLRVARHASSLFPAMVRNRRDRIRFTQACASVTRNARGISNSGNLEKSRILVPER